MTDFDGRVALITGGAGGIGGATARALQASGARVAILDNSAARLAEAQAAFADAILLEGDVTDLVAMQDACARIESEAGRLDILVNVAGGGLPRSIETMTGEEWQRTIALNLTGPFNMIKAAAPLIGRSGGGAVVTVASLAALGISLNSGASYTAAKAGILGLTRQAAYELASDGIRVNAVLPGAIMTPQMRAKLSPEAYAAIPKRAPLGRWITPDEVAQPIVFLCSEGAAAITGTHLLVDGGWLIGGPEDRDAYFRQRGHA